MRGDEQMDVVGHQRVGMKLAVVGCGGFVEPIEVDEVIRFGKETGLAIMPALNDMKRHGIKVSSGAARHVETIPFAYMVRQT
jgi:hypothetical protein